MFTGQLESGRLSDKHLECDFTGTTVETMSGELERFMSAEKYKLEEGSRQSGLYGRGNRTLRMLLGAFVPRYRWQIQITPDREEGVSLSISKGMSGFSGGFIGMSLMKKEIRRLGKKILAQCRQ